MKNDSLDSMLKNISWILPQEIGNTPILKDEKLELIKERPHRKVFKGKDIFVKAFRVSVTEKLLKRNGALKEFSIANFLFERGRAPRPIAYGISGKWSLFVSKKVEGESLATFLSKEWPTLNKRERAKYIERFSLLLKDLYETGVMQPDFHLDNVFINKKENDFVLIDLHRAILTNSTLSTEQACQQLRFVLPPLSRYLTRHEILRAVAYLSNWLQPLKKRDKRFSIHALSCKDVAANCHKKLDRRLANSTVSKGFGSRHRVFLAPSVDEGMAASLFKSIFENRDSIQNIPETEIVKDSRHTFCFRLKIDKKTLFIKCYRSSGNIKSISYLFRQPRVIRSWRASWLLNYLGIKTILPLVAIQGKNPWNHIYGLTAYPWIDGLSGIKDRVRKLLEKEDERHHLLNSLALFIWNMHQKGVQHGDCKITNFVISRATKANMDFAIFDLDAIKFTTSPLSDRQRMKDLEVMARSLGKIADPGLDMASLFLKAYCRFHVPWQDKTR